MTVKSAGHRRHTLRQFSGLSDNMLMGVIYAFLIFVLIVILIPIINIIASSFSSSKAVVTGKVTLWPVDFSLKGYQAVFNNRLIAGGFLNSLYYMVIGTSINLIVTMLAAYPLSHKSLVGRRAITFFFSFTMFFSGGMIPTYLVVKDLGMIDTVWAMVIPGAMSVYNVIIARTFMQNSIPYDLYESAMIDGCSYCKAFFRITLPLSKSVIAVLTLMFAVGHWNAYFGALMYLRTQSKFPLQLVLRQILVLNSFNINDMTASMVEDALDKQYLANLLKYSVIVVATTPLMILYPFIQQHFVKGVMLGSIKG